MDFMSPLVRRYTFSQRYLLQSLSWVSDRLFLPEYLQDYANKQGGWGKKSQDRQMHLSNNATGTQGNMLIGRVT